MAQRKIKLTMSGNLVDNIGPIVDIEFDGESLETDFEIDVEHGTSTIVREYTVDKSAGEYNLNFTFKNDWNETSDRNFVIEKIEVANNGTDYLLFRPTEIMETVTNEDGTSEEVNTGNFEEFDPGVLVPLWDDINKVYFFKQFVNGTAPLKITFS